ncbi:MAG: LamG domain-containing protein [Alphaproteobacteria bacterium]|nr:LamG domain-containing protein [Alphaproteobacteria bacterium]
MGSYPTVGLQHAIGGGFWDNNEYFTGRLDDIRVYNRSLSVNEIAELYRMNTTSVVNTGSALTSSPQ